MLLSLPAQAPDDGRGFVTIEHNSPVPDERRVALVVGNSRYEALGALKNPAADAALLARSLRQVGFEVTEAYDLDRDDMLTAVREFGRRIKDADVAFFYFSGHGLQQEGRAYMVPTSARIRIASDIELEAVDVGRVLARMEDGGERRTNLVFLDACRNNPIPRQTRAPVAGLASIDAPVGSLIAYATAPGRTASDGSGNNGPFAAALAEEMLTPGAAIETVMKRVRVRVQRASDGAQIPWQSSSLTREFYFVPGGAEPLAVEETSPSTVMPSSPAPAVASRDEDDEVSVSRRRRRPRDDAAAADDVPREARAVSADFTWADWGYYISIGTAFASFFGAPIGGVLALALTFPALMISQLGGAWSIVGLVCLIPSGVLAVLALMMPLMFCGGIASGLCFNMVSYFVPREGPMPPRMSSSPPPPAEHRPPTQHVAAMSY